jgi:signal peptidase I
MNDFNLSSDSGLPTAKPASRRKKAALAGILSLLIPGMGQLVNRQPRKAMVLGVMMYLLRLLQVHAHWMLAFGTMMGMMVAALASQLGVAAEAAYSAGREKNEEAAIPLAKISYPVLAILLLAGVFFPTTDQAIRESGFGAFRVASGSMCPTICEGERVVANRKAYQSAEPQRGDVILVKHEASEGPFLKRIIGLPGDVITQGPEGTVLVNGAAFHPPAPCGKPVWKGPSSPNCPMCETATVKPGEYFVIGDDLGNSFDSRYKEFGPVTRELLVGKVLFIAWSGSRSRIGCTVK